MTKVVKAGRPKSAEKRQLILVAAGNLFLQHGFAGCSMDMVAKQSTVSKQTVYSHFANKEALFTAVIESKCAEYQLDNAHLEQEHGNLIELLHKYGLQIIKLLHDPQVIALYQVVIGESASNPHVAQLFYDAGPLQSVEMLSKCFQRFEHNSKSAEQAYTYAITYVNLLKGDFHMKSILNLDFALTEKQQLAHVDSAIEQITWLINRT